MPPKRAAIVESSSEQDSSPENSRNTSATKASASSILNPRRTTRNASASNSGTTAAVSSGKVHSAPTQVKVPKRKAIGESKSTAALKVTRVFTPASDTESQDHSERGFQDDSWGQGSGGDDGQSQDGENDDRGHVVPQDGSWLYPNLLDAINANDKGSADMDVDRSHGYILDHILRVHSRSTHEGQDEKEQDTWAVAFQPSLPVIRTYSHLPQSSDNGEDEKEAETSESDGDDDDEAAEQRRIRRQSRNIARERSRRQKKSSSIVATCGGNTVCLIDCRLGKVMAKYSHVEEEDFMSLAWTTLDHAHDVEEQGKTRDEKVVLDEDRHDQSNILAAAGRLGSIKLINPLQNSCYKYLHGHTASIVRLKFSLTNPRWLFSASTDGTARLWDIGSLTDYETEACCLAKFANVDNSSITAIGVSEKYLIVGTETGYMVQYDLFQLTKEIEKAFSTGAALGAAGAGKKWTPLTVKPEKIYPPSQEWHESSVDEIVYIPYFSAKSYAAKKSRMAMNLSMGDSESTKGVRGQSRKTRGGATHGRGRGRGRGRVKAVSKANGRGPSKDEDGNDEDDEGEFVFASRESMQGEIIVWEASRSTAEDAELKTILEWSIAESWTKFGVGENMSAEFRKAGAEGANSHVTKDWRDLRQNVLVTGSTDGKLIMYDLARTPKRARDGNIVAQKSSNVLSHPESVELFRDVAVSQDLSMIVAGDWTNRVLIWNYHEDAQ